MINKLEEIEIFNYYDNPMYIKLNSNSYGDKIEGAYGEDDPASIFIKLANNTRDFSHEMNWLE